MNFKKIAENNLNCLRRKKYPGRGIIVGMTPDAKNIVQIYWTMGRTKNSRNRVFNIENNFVRTEAFDISKLEDPSLIIYNCIAQYNDIHVVANGDQSDTIINFLENDESIDKALNTREYEPDDPNCTPRITGIVNLNQKGYNLSILKSIHNRKGIHNKSSFYYPQYLEGYGHLIHTYDDDGSPLPSFRGEPNLIELQNNQEDNLNRFWSILDKENRVSILVKYLDIKTKQVKIISKNKLTENKSSNNTSSQGSTSKVC